MHPSNSPVDFLAAFLGGVLVSFSPCIYPLIPITAGYIGASGASTRMKGLILSLIYVTGIAVTYSLLGIIAILSGSIFGRFTMYPAVYIAVGIIVVFFGLSMLDLFTLRLPHFFKLSAPQNKGYFSCFFLGLSSGLVVSPCVTPVLGSILAYLATRKNLLYGIILLFSFAYGMGLTLILIGSLSAFLPKPGKWMLYLKKICALLLIGAGFYLIYTAIKMI